MYAVASALFVNLFIAWGPFLIPLFFVMAVTFFGKRVVQGRRY